MCDYSLHAVATRPAQVGETLITTTFRGTSTRGFAIRERSRCRRLHAARHRTRLRRKRQIRQPLDLDARDQFPRGQIRRYRPAHSATGTMTRSNSRTAAVVLVTLLCEGQRVTVLQLPVIAQPATRARACRCTGTSPAPLSAVDWIECSRGYPPVPTRRCLPRHRPLWLDRPAGSGRHGTAR